MKLAALLYAAFLLLEGLLAWLLGHDSLLFTGSMLGLIAFALVRHHPKAISEGVRLATAAVLAIVGPLHYQNNLTPLMLCFIALPHFLAATQALSGADSARATPSQPRRNAMTFSIAFYAAIGLIFLLARGMAPLPRLLTTFLAVTVLLAALAAWDLSRLPRLRQAKPAGGFSWGQLSLPLGLLALAVLLYLGPLPWAADQLCRISPHRRIDPMEFKNKPPHQPPTQKTGSPADQPASRTGMDESAITSEHRLPSRSDLRMTEAPRFLLRLDAPDTPASLLAQGPAYLRSHTLNRFSDDKWRAEVTGGLWVEDGEDGTTDGRITLHAPTQPPGISHEVFAIETDGYTLPTLPGLTEIQLPRVYAVPGDILQAALSGNIRYRALSTPSLYRNLPNPALLNAGKTDQKIHLKPADGPTGGELAKLADKIFTGENLPSAKINDLQAWFAKNLRYSTVMENKRGLSPLQNFLMDERRGFCDFFASAGALLLRQAGLPTRVAYGFASREIDPESGLILFRDRHAHAWTEIFLENYGWTLCDFTPSDNVGQPSPENAPKPPPLPNLDQFSDAARDDSTAKPIPAPKVETPFFAKILAWLRQITKLGPLLNYVPWVLGGVVLLLALIRFWRRPRPDPALAEAAARAAADQPPPYYGELLRLSAAAGHPKPEGSTPLEHYQLLLRSSLPAAPLAPLLHYHCAIRYEDAPRDPAQEQSFASLLTAFAQSFAPAVSPPQASSS